MKKGVSLIILVITIMVMIILAGVVLSNLKNDNTIDKAAEVTFKENLYRVNELVQMKVSEIIENEEIDRTDVTKTVAETKKLLGNISKEFDGYVCIQNGELKLKGYPADEFERQWIADMKIEMIN